MQCGEVSLFILYSIQSIWSDFFFKKIFLFFFLNIKQIDQNSNYKSKLSDINRKKKKIYLIF